MQNIVCARLSLKNMPLGYPGSSHWIEFDQVSIDPGNLWNASSYYLEMTNQTEIRRWRYTLELAIKVYANNTTERESLVYIVLAHDTQDPTTLRNKMYFPASVDAGTVHHYSSGIVETSPIGGSIIIGAKHFLEDNGEAYAGGSMLNGIITLWEVT